MKEIQIETITKDNKIMIDSLTVAKILGVMHKNILQSIDATKEKITFGTFDSLYYETIYIACNGEKKAKVLNEF